MGSYFINNKLFDRNELIAQAHSVLDGKYEEWEKNIWSTIKEWFNDSNTISFHTSGTTGKPKIIHHTKESIRAGSLLTRKFFKLPEKSKVLLCLPAHFVAGKMMIYRALICNWDLYYTKPSTTIDIPSNIQYDFVAMVPMQVKSILQNNSPQLGQFKTILIGGSSVSQSLKEVLKKYPNSFYESYGSTETLTHVAMKNIKENNVFEALDGITFSIDHRNCLGIIARHISKNTIQTNDLVNLKSESTFEYVGRYDDIINSGGVKINPIELEEKINGLINFEFYIGKKKDELLGEKVVLYLEKNSSQLLNVEALNQELASKLNKFERPKEIIIKDKFERTFSGKIKRDQWVGGKS